MKLVARLILVFAIALSGVALACPFCTVESQTLSEEIDSSDAAVIAYLVKPALPPGEGPDALGEFGVVDPDTGRAVFRIDRIEKGEDLLAGMETLETVYFGDADFEKPFLIRAIANEDGSMEWNIPLPLTKLGMQYVDDLKTLPAEGAERLAYFLQFLQHEDPLLAQDAYDEFARAPYESVTGLKDRIDKEQLWQWIDSRDVSASRRSLFFTMLGVCGDRTDADRLEQMMLSDTRALRSAAEASAAASIAVGGPIGVPVIPEMVAMEERRKQLGFNALVGCYLKLRGAEGLDVVDRHFLGNPDADYTQVYATCLALRFLGEETQVVPMERLRQSMRLVLDKPEFAQQAIVDLSRWEDWTILDRLVDMYDTAPDRTYVKEPIIAYLDRASQQPGETGARASDALKVLEEQDPDTVKRARSLLAFGFLGQARAANPSNSDGAGGPTLDVATTDTAAEESATDETSADAGKEVVEEGAILDIPEPTAPPSTEPVTTPVEAADSESDTSANPSAVQESGDPSLAGQANSNVPSSATPDEAPVARPNAGLLVALPLVALVGFMALVWLILRGGV
jgi:hypothetical protein